MTRERLTKPIAPLQRAPDAVPQSRVRASPIKPVRLQRSLEAKPVTAAQLEVQRIQQLELQRQADLEVQRAAIQRAHDERFQTARASQSTWRSSSLKSVGVQRAASEHARTARTAQSTRAAFIAQRSSDTLEALVAQRLEAEVRPALPVVQRQADLTLSHVADHLGSKAAVQLARDPDRLSSYAGFKNTGASLVKNFRAPGSSHTMPELAGAIQRFRDPMQRAAVESAAYAAFGSHPTYSKQLQRALETRDQQLEVQRESWKSELEPVAQRMASEEASGEGAAQQIESARGGGQPLPEHIRNLLETKWNADLSKVRIHTDSSAASISKKLNAKALTTGQDIFFGASTFNPTSLEGLQLIAHEAWHTVQQAQGLVQAGVDRDQSLEVEARGKGAELSSGDLQVASNSESKATRSDANASIRQTVVGNLISRTASPEWRALTASVWGDPSSGSAASSQAKPFEQDAYTQTKASETTAPPSSQTSISSQTAPSGLKTNHAIPAAPRASSSVQVQRSPDGRFNVQRDSLTVQRFSISGAISSALGNIPGYKELCAVFGKDLVTGDAVQANPDAILDKLATFVPEPLKDMVKALRETRAIPKAWAWFKAELKKINIGAAWNAVKKAIGDASIWSPNESIDRVKAAVMQPINGLKALIAGSIRKLAEIALEAIGAAFGPAAKPIIDGLKGAGSVIGEVFKNPGKFIGNLVSAVKGGFKNFGNNAQKHLSTGAGQWLTGESGIAFPQNLDVKGVFTVVLSVLGISYVNFRKSLVKKIGEDKTKVAESKVSMVQTLMTKGMGAAEGMNAHEGAVKSEVIDGIKTEVKNSVIKTAVLKLVSMFVPGGGLVQLFVTAFDMVKFFMSEGQRIFSLISSVMQSVAAIASGNISAAVAGVETSLAKSIPVALSFMSKIFKVSGIGTKIKAIINKVKSRIELVVSRVMDKAAALVAKVVGTGKTVATNAIAGVKKLMNGVFGKKSFAAGKEQHSIWVKVTNNQPELWIASTPREARAQIAALELQAKNAGTYALVKPSLDKARAAIDAAIKKLKTLTTSVDDEKKKREAESKMTGVVNGVVDSVTDVFNQLGQNGGDASKLKVNLNAGLIRKELWPSGGRPGWAKATLDKLAAEFPNEHVSGTSNVQKGFDRRHIEAFDDIVKREIIGVNGKTYTDAQSYLAGRGHKPKTAELEPIKLSVKDLLKKEFNAEANLWVGAAKPNQQKGADFAAAERNLENMDRNSPEYKAELERRSRAAVDPALGTRGGGKIGANQDVQIQAIKDVTEAEIQRLEKAKRGTPRFEDAKAMRLRMINYKRSLGDFTKICDPKEVAKIAPSLEKASSIIFRLTKTTES